MEKPKVNSVELQTKAKAGGLDIWFNKLGLSSSSLDDFTSVNDSKEVQMEKMHLPQLRHYGFFKSVQEISDKLTNADNPRFIIRCSNKEKSEIKRFIDTDLEGAIKFAEALPGGFDKWDVEMKEFVKTKAAGTIIVHEDGSVIIETWYGPHYNVNSDCPKFFAKFDPDIPQRHFVWQAPENDSEHLDEVRGFAINALRYVAPNVAPKSGNRFYIEYGVREDGSVYFIEGNDAELLTSTSGGLSKK